MKELIEKKNDLIEQMTNIVNTAKAENRAVNEEEAKQFNDCEAEIKKIENTIEMEKKMENLENKKPMPVMTDEAKKDEIAFINLIKDIKNSDTPVTYGENGAIVPKTIAQRIISKVYATCPILERADKYNIRGTFSIPYESSDTIEMSYTDEFDDDEDSKKVVIASINLADYLAKCLVKVSKQLINNTDFDIVGYIVDRIALKARKFIEKELLNGTENKIEGLSGIAEEMIVETEEVGAVGGDDLINLQETVLDEFQNDAIFIMSRNTRKAIRKLKDQKGDYLLEKDLNAKWNYVLLGKPVYTTDQIGDDVVFYGDMSGLAVKFSEDVNIQILREKYATQHALGVLAFVGLDAKVENKQKIAKLTVKSA